MCLIPVSERSPGGGHGNTLQFYFLERPMDSRAWQTTVLGGHRELDMTEATQHQHQHQPELEWVLSKDAFVQQVDIEQLLQLKSYDWNSW